MSVPMLEFKVDNEGYIFLQEQKGDRVYVRYLLVDVPNCAQYGKVKLGDVAEVKVGNE